MKIIPIWNTFIIKQQERSLVPSLKCLLIFIEQPTMQDTVHIYHYRQQILIGSCIGEGEGEGGVDSHMKKIG